MSRAIPNKVEVREVGVEGQGLSCRPTCRLPQRIAPEVELPEGGVDAQRISYRPPRVILQIILFQIKLDECKVILPQSFTNRLDLLYPKALLPPQLCVLDGDSDN